MGLRDNWDPQLESGLPDCRRRGAPTIVRARMLWEQVFCANCGAPGGLITAEFSPHVFYQCDDCAVRLGPIPGVDQVPDAVVAAHTKT